MPGAGALTDRLVFQRRSTTPDDYGNEEAGFADAFTEPAELVILGLGNEAIAAARLEGRQPVTIRVRHNSRTVQIQADWRAMDERNPGIVYALTAAPVDRERKRRWLEIPAVLGAAA
jgi:head-tail adaptor